MDPNNALALAGSGMVAAGMLIRLLIDLSSVLLLVGFIYYPLHRQKDYMFTFFVFNLVIFIICLLLGASRIQMGFAFGLFALFSILRYRTILIPVKEMGYFFVCVAMGIFNALVSEENHFVILLCADGLLLAAVFILDRYVTLNHETSKEIIYERIDLIKPVNRPEMLDDLATRTGLPVHRVEIISIDFLRDTATIRAFYFEKKIRNAVPTAP